MYVSSSHNAPCEDQPVVVAYALAPIAIYISSRQSAAGGLAYYTQARTHCELSSMPHTARHAYNIVDGTSVIQCSFNMCELMLRYLI